MADRGYSTESKIKILYEDGLRDIREISSRMENLMTRLEAANQPNTFLHGIDAQISVLALTGLRFERLQTEILSAVDEVKAVHDAHIANIVTEGKTHISAQTEKQIALFEKAAMVRSEVEIRAIVEASQKSLNKAITDLALEKFQFQNSALSEAINVFESKSEEFKSVIETQSSKAIRAAEGFKNKLESIQPLSWVGQSLSIVASGAVGAAIALLSQHFTK
ncbi:MAG: hypothetical protein Q8K61_10605 [Gallionella sp.]|nr:hypothetical protein [Gallionella sp.]